MSSVDLCRHQRQELLVSYTPFEADRGPLASSIASRSCLIIARTLRHSLATTTVSPPTTLIRHQWRELLVSFRQSLDSHRSQVHGCRCDASVAENAGKHIDIPAIPQKRHRKCVAERMPREPYASDPELLA